MDLLYVSTVAAILFSILVISLRYLSLLRWISGRAYVFSKIEGRLTSKDVLDLLKFSKPFPVSCQKGWKIDNFSHGHRVWFHFLTQPDGHQVLNNVKVYGAYSKVRASSQFVLQLLKDISLTCEWKPGVIATSFVLTSTTPQETPTKSRTTAHVHHDIIKEEKVYRKSTWLNKPSWESLVTQTVTEEYSRYSNREENGCCWLLQINEAGQKWTFYLAQPVEGWFETDQCMLSIISHCGLEDETKSSSYSARNLSALEEYLINRKLVGTPLSTLTMPSPAQIETKSEPNGSVDQIDGTKRNPTRFLTRVRSFMSGNSGKLLELQKSELKRYNSILRYRSSSLHRDEGTSSVKKKEPLVRNSSNESSQDRDDLATNINRTDQADIDLSASETDGSQTKFIPFTRTPSDPSESQYKTLANFAAGEIMAEALKASNIDLDKSVEEQAESSNGWVFTGIENDIVMLKKVFKDPSTVQCYMGKGLVQAPPKIVWENLKNPRTRFTYDETLKKVDILEKISERMKIVYQYHEVQQLLRKDCCEMCVLQSERKDGEKYTLSYQTVDYKIAEPSGESCIKPTLLPSGWIIEPARKDKRVYSIVTYLMQMDFGPRKANSDKFPFEDMISKQPLAIFHLQQYLQPAVMLARQVTV
ncbi:hypothetical protein SNE40_010246 [Patella caerulea]|uniref:START domain-containing protein n=1 Tax=Patella caerulea TaxID=87958 RepID=A0AAN8JQ60_PATCE